MAKKVGRLKSLIIDRVDLVDQGGNQEAHIALFKRREGVAKKTMQQVMDEPRRQLYALQEAFNSAFYDSMWDGEEDDLLVSIDQLKEKVSTVLGSTSVEKAKGGTASMTMEEVLKGLAPDQAQIIQDAIKAFQDKIAEQAAVIEKGAPVPEEPFDKSALPEAVRKQLDEYEKRIAAAERVAKEERDARRAGEFAKRAESFAKVAPVETIASLLQETFDHSEELGKRLEGVLTAAEERIALSKEIGDAGTDTPSGAYETLLVKAQEIQKSTPGMTHEAAFSKALEVYPDLYSQYVKEN